MFTSWYTRHMTDRIKGVWFGAETDNYFSAFLYIACVRVLIFGAILGFGTPVDYITQGFAEYSIVPAPVWGALVITNAIICIVGTVIKNGDVVLYSSMALFTSWLYLSFIFLNQGIQSLAIIEFATCMMFGWFYVSTVLNRRWGVETHS